MVKVTRDEVIKLAHMSQISVHENEVPGLIKELEAVLAYASGLKAIADAHQGVVALPKNSNVFRTDDPVQFDSRLILAQAPEREAHYFVVPVVIK
jgi:aspartyl-tRNA(Asn)/glutamyl-tRNA(Gln) amidotransferase subunit C